MGGVDPLGGSFGVSSTFGYMGVAFYLPPINYFSWISHNVAENG